MTRETTEAEILYLAFIHEGLRQFKERLPQYGGVRHRTWDYLDDTAEGLTMFRRSRIWWEGSLRPFHEHVVGLPTANRLIEHLLSKYGDRSHRHLSRADPFFVGGYLIHPLRVLLDREPADVEQAAREVVGEILQYLTSPTVQVALTIGLPGVTYSGPPRTSGSITVRRVDRAEAERINNDVLGFVSPVPFENMLSAGTIVVDVAATVPTPTPETQMELYERARDVLVLLLAFHGAIRVAGWWYHAVGFSPFDSIVVNPSPLRLRGGPWCIDSEVDALLGFLDDTFPSLRDGHREVRTAARRFLQSFEEDETDDCLLELTMALEALLGTGNQDLTRSLAQRLGVLVGGDGDDRLAVQQHASALYKARSAVVCSHRSEIDPGRRPESDPPRRRVA